MSGIIFESLPAGTNTKMSGIDPFRAPPGCDFWPENNTKDHPATHYNTHNQPATHYNTHTDTYIYIHIYIHACIYIYIYIYMYTYLYICM